MVRKAMISKDEKDQIQDVEALFEAEVTAEGSPVVETVLVTEVEAVPVIVAEVETIPATEAEEIPVIFEANVQSDDGDKYSNNLKTLTLKLAELEDKLVKLEIELSLLVKKRRRLKGMKKEKVVKCKCKGKKVPLSKCKCKSKKVAKKMKG